MELISYAARLATETILSRADLRAAGVELAIHAAGGLLVLLVPAVLSVYKPRGLTPYGHRKQLEHRAPLQQPPSERPSLDSNGDIGVWSRGASVTITLRRAHMYGVIVIVLVLHLVILHLNGIGVGGH
jgi:hypothetical protein